MTKNETAQIMAILKAAYPSYYATQKEQDIKSAVELWHEMFAEDDVQYVGAAVKTYINADTKGFPPSIGQIREKINLLTRQRGMTEQEAWNQVVRAISNSWYHAKEEFDKLPMDLQNLVGSPNQLREWGLMDRGQLQTVVASNFMRSYRERMKDKKEVESLPENIKNNMLLSPEKTITEELGEKQNEK